MLDGENIAVYDADGNRLKGMKLLNIMSSGDYMPEFYVDENNEVKTVVLRAATKDDMMKKDLMTK